MLKKMLSTTFVRYVIVGFISVGIDYGSLLIGFHVLGWPLAFATTAGFSVGLVINFLLNKFWSFETSHDAKQTTKQAAMVTVLVAFNLTITNIVVIRLNKWNIGPEISKVITMAMITCWNYVLYKKYIFKKRKVVEPPIV